MSFATVADGAKVLSVTELTLTVKELLEEAFPMVWVAGEISNLTRPSSGHVYLTLKDSQSQLRAIIWRTAAGRLRFEPVDGLQVIVRGRLTVYPPRGDYQLQIEEMQPKGLGAQELALRQLKEKLQKLGYFAPERKKKLPTLPRRLALITSPSGAAVRDMLEMLARRWPYVEAWVCPVRVQGDGAGQEVAAAVRTLNRLHNRGFLAFDVVIIGRGGGSTEDLWAFNQECVAKAIFESTIPIVSAVGHEIDLTIADLVADVRALTPTQAATLVVPDRTELLVGLRQFESRMSACLAKKIDQGKRSLQEMLARRAFRLPLERVREREQRLDDRMARLSRALKQRLARARERLEADAARLETLSPLNVLGRGYSLTRRLPDETVVRSAEQVKAGDLLATTLQHGRIISRVEETEDGPDAGTPA